MGARIQMYSVEGWRSLNPFRLERWLAAVTAFVCACVLWSPAYPCKFTPFANDGRYIGGDLATQIARKADVIQVVRASSRMLLTRTYSVAAYFLSEGKEAPLPSELHEPEYTDLFAVKFEILETLKDTRVKNSIDVGEPLRIAAYGAAEYRDFWRSIGHPLNDEIGPKIPDYLLDRPLDEGVSFRSAVPPGDESSCFGRSYKIDIGDIFVALRTNVGQLYLVDSALLPDLQTGLQINFEAVDGYTKEKLQTYFNMQPLALVHGPSDPFLLRLREAINAQDKTK